MTKILTTTDLSNCVYIIDVKETLCDSIASCIRGYVGYVVYCTHKEDIGRTLYFYTQTNEWNVRDLTKKDIEKYFVELL